VAATSPRSGAENQAYNLNILQVVFDEFNLLRDVIWLDALLEACSKKERFCDSILEYKSRAYDSYIVFFKYKCVSEWA
jgi:hypothetical protein